MQKQKIKETINKIILLLFLPFCILSGFILDHAIIKALQLVQLYQPQREAVCDIATSTLIVATSTPVTKATSTKYIGVIREVSAYNSLEAQTDSSPCVGADGTDLCKRYQAGECIVASNAFKLGAKVDVQGFGTCTVADRMNKRFQNRVDVFMDKDHSRAISFGVQRLMVSLVNFSILNLHLT